MKFSQVLSCALGAATTVSVTPPLIAKRAPTDPLPNEKFGWFSTISLEDARSGILKSHNGTISKIMEGLGNSFEDVTDEIAESIGLGSSSPSPASSSTGEPKIAPIDDPIDNVTSVAIGCDNPNQRFEWRDYSDTDRHAFAAAFKCLMDAPSSGRFPPSQSRYEDLVRVHQMMANTIHGNSIFLLWHRYYVWTLEQIMRDECGFDRAFPWWDETLDAGNFSSSSIFTPDFFGSLRTSTNDQYICVTDGYFANAVAHIGPGSGFQDHCLSRAVDESLTAQCNKNFVNICNSRDNYSDMENCAELGPHAYGHNGIGSVMADASSSPQDPTFFLHHLFVDRNFWLWQDGDASRKTKINGCIDNSSPCTPLTLDTVINVQGLRPNVTVRDVIDTQNGVICYYYTY
ncbi:hypothetical protein BKA67DRAFT_537140 [Truncatella angustata]|uniref:Tyrosinase copper-binding domain-containing protein n=2 Tax=Truncatella angustata TaxID=152316 RepID=A0A9P8UK50_9PEZI|nr:uncharacterized protein BKA67DRAFT_537140 [Truncatella angustata]KAH6653465.1 hypothetical protein BKA67DRAFT_537140 [Truncatella angustata]